MDDSYVTICICNFNTTQLTNNCIRSINSKVKRFPYKVVVLDNSDKIPFCIDEDVKKRCSIYVIDNTKNQIIDFNAIMKQSPFKLMSFNANNFGSLKHACSIQFLLNICQTRFMLLFDSDTIVLNDIDFIDPRFVSIADLEEHGKMGRNGKKYSSFTRMCPFIQFFNVKMINDHRLKYFDYSRIHGILAPKRGNYYDTGASFYADITKIKLPFKRIDYKRYINHLDHGSWIKEFDKYLK